MSYLLLQSGTTDKLVLENGTGDLLLEGTASPSVSPTSATINQGATTTIAASNFTGGTVTWSTSNGSVATVDSSGVVTGQPHGQATAQTATITATGVANPTENASATITVNAVAVTVSPTSTAIGTSQTIQITPSVTGTTTTTVTWSVVSGAGSVNSSGLYTAPGTATTATVRATSTADTARHADCVITVSPTHIETAVAPYGSAYTGLTIGYTIYNADGTVFQAHTTSGVTEIGSTGIYHVSAILAQSFIGLMIFDAPSGIDPYVHEVNPWLVAGTTYTILAVAPYGVAYTGLSIGYTIYNTDNTTTPAPGHAHTTSGVVEFNSLGIYGVQLSFNLTDDAVIVWDAPVGLDPFVQEVTQQQPLTSSGGVSGSRIFGGF